MDISLILVVVGFLVGFYLIFKFIKKLIFAVFAVILLFVVVVASVFGIVYLDYKQLSSTTNFDVDVIYLSGSDYVFGTKIMIKENTTLDLSSFKGLSKSDLNTINVYEITKADNLFVVEVDSVLFNTLIENKTFTFDQFQSNDAFSSFTMELTGAEISNLMNSNNAKEDFVNLLLDKNNMKGIIRTTIKPVIDAEINKLPFEMKEVLFLAVMQESLKDKENILTLLKAYKNDEGISVYPDRLTFKLLRALPINKIESYIPTNPLN